MPGFLNGPEQGAVIIAAHSGRGKISQGRRQPAGHSLRNFGAEDGDGLPAKDDAIVSEFDPDHSPSTADLVAN